MYSKRSTRQVSAWGIPALYAGAALVAGLTVPRIEYHFLPGLDSGMSIASATAIDSGARQPFDEQRLRNEIKVGEGRTFEQDPKYVIRLLVDIAIKALSPAINDPTTAVQALDQIEDLLLRLGQRQLDVGAFRDKVGKLRVIIPFPTWQDYLHYS